MGPAPAANGNDAASPNAADPVQTDAFAGKITLLTQPFAGRMPPDFANLSFAELLALVAGQPTAE